MSFVKKYKGELILLLASFLWGSSLVAQKLGTYHLEAFSFSAARTLLGAACLLPVVLLMDARTSKEEREKKGYKKKDLLIGGILCGITLCMGTYFQQLGLSSTTVGKAGFISTMYIVIIPIVSVFRRKKVGAVTWLGVIIAVVGLYLLCMKENMTMEKGDLIVLIGTIFWAAQILVTDEYASRTEGLKLTLVMFFTTGVLSLIGALLFESPTIQAVLEGWKPLLYTAVFAVAGGYSLQLIGQRTADPVSAGIIITTESIFSVICAAVFLGETMTKREWVGVILIFAAILLTQTKKRVDTV